MTLIINGKTYEAGELIGYVENLEKENAELKDYNKKLLQSDIDKQNKIVLLSQKVNDLQKKNAELDCQKNRNKACYSCVNATERCFTNEIGCPCEKYKSYKDENEKLNEKLLEQKQYTEFKCNESVKRKEVYEKEHFLLTKAKEIIKKYLAIGVGGKITQNYLDVTKEAEQFINNEGCPDCFCEDCTKEDCGIKKLGLVEVEK